MGRIYATAIITFIWLDGERAAAKKVFAILSHVGSLTATTKVNGTQATLSIGYGQYGLHSSTIL